MITHFTAFARRANTPLALLLFAAALVLAQTAVAQNAIVGAGFTSGWSTTGNFEYLSSSAGSTWIRIDNANGTGNQYFRMGVDWGGTTGQHTISPGSDTQVFPNTEYTLNSSSTGSGALYFNVSSTSDNYIFKTANAGPTPSHNLIVFQVQGSVESISSVAQSPAAGVVPACGDVTVTATRSAAFSTGQGVYLRYTDDGYTTSTVVEMSLSGSDYVATIPGSTNTASANISYYVFTSGAGLSIDAADADWYTINLNNNGGSNYSYTVGSQINTAADGNWNTGATWCSGSVPVAGASPTIQHDVTLDINTNVGDLTIESGHTLTGGAQILTVNSAGTMLINGSFAGSGTDLRLSSGALLDLNGNNTTIGMVQEAGSSNSGTIDLGSGTLTLDGVDFGTVFQNSITGTGGLTMAGSGSSSLNLFGTQDFTGTLSVSGGAVLSAVAFSTTTIDLSGGRLETTADNLIDDAAAIAMSSGSLDLQNEAVGSINATGGSLELDAGQTLTVGALSLADGVLSAASGSVLVLQSGTHTLGNSTSNTVDHLILESGATLNFLNNAELVVNGTLELRGGTMDLNAGGAITGFITYGSGAEVYYNSGSTVSPAGEWSSSLSPDAIRIGNGTTVNLDEAGLSVADLDIESGGSLDQNGFDLTQASSGTITNNGSWTAGTNTVVFEGGNTVAGGSTTTFYNVDLDGGGVDFGSNSAVDNNLRILAGGFVNTNRPTYNSGATLIYETGGSYSINASSREWALGTNTNNPPNVEVRSSSVSVDATSGDGLRCGAFTTTSTGSIEFQPPNNPLASPKPSPFFLLHVDGNTSLAGSGSFTVLNGDGNDLKGTASDGFYDVLVQGDLDIAAGFTMTMNADIGDDLLLQGDFTINGTFDPQDRAVYFDGTALQVLTDNASPQTEFAFVRIQNEVAPPSIGVQVTTDWLIDDQLELEDGVLQTDAGQTLTLNSNAIITENASRSYMNGETVQTKTLSGSSAIDIAYGLSINPNGENLGSTTATTTSGPDGIQSNHLFGANEGIAKVWDVVPTNQPTANVDLTFNWVNAHSNGKDSTDIEGWRKPVGAVAWKRWAASADLAAGNPFTVGAISTDTFSQFTFSDGATPLPVELVDFIGSLVQAGVELAWVTAAELNNSHFVVERSTDGFGFAEIGRVQGAGSTTRMQEYQFLDPQAQTGLNYYRLRQVDLDGTESLSKVIVLRVEASQSASVYPVPASDWVYMEWTFQTDRSVVLQLVDAAGRIQAGRSAEGQKGQQRFALDLSDVPVGLYQLVLSTDGGEILHKAPVSVQ